MKILIAGRTLPPYMLKYVNYLHSLHPLKTIFMVDLAEEHHEYMLEGIKEITQFHNIASLPHVYGNLASDNVMRLIFKKNKFDVVVVLSNDDQSQAAIRIAFEKGIKVIKHGDYISPRDVGQGNGGRTQTTGSSL